MQDPFFEVKSEVEQQAIAVKTLYSRWCELLVHPALAKDDGEFGWSTDNIRLGINGIESDLQDLNETISIVESNRSKFRISDDELESRKAFISNIRSTIFEISKSLQNPKQTHAQLLSDKKKSLIGAPKKRLGSNGFTDSTYSRLDDELERENDEFIDHHQIEMKRIEQDQDVLLDRLSTNTEMIGHMGNQISEEVQVHSELLSDLTQKTITTEGRVRSAVKKVEDIIDKSSDAIPWVMIGVLVLILALVIFFIII